VKSLRWGVKYTGEFAIFDGCRRLSRKRYEIDPWLLWNVNRKSWVTDRSVSVPMTLSELASGQIFRPNLRNYARTVWPKTNKLGTVTRVGRGYYWEVSHGADLQAPWLGGQLRVRARTLSNFEGSWLFLPIPFWRRTTKFDVVTHMGRGLVFRGLKLAPLKLRPYGAI